MAPNPISVEFTLAHTEERGRVISSTAKCPFCQRKFENTDAVMLLIDLVEQRQYGMHVRCIAASLVEAPRDCGVDEREFDAFRSAVLQRMSSTG